MVNILVIDRHHAETIAKSIEGHLRGEVRCFIDNPPEFVKIDLFIVSGKTIIDEIYSTSNLKKEYGSDKAKVLAISVADGVLDEIQRTPKFGVDFILRKEMILDFLLATSGQKNKDVDIRSNLSEIMSTYA